MSSAQPRTRRPGKKSVSWRNDTEILRRLPGVERRHLAGLSNYRIADALGIAEATVREDLKRIRQVWRERTGESIEHLKAQAIAELEDVRQRALAAAEWDQMCEKAVLFGGSIDDEDGDETVLSVYRDLKGSAQFRGNKAQALNTARQASMDKAKVLGIVVDKQALTNPDGNQLTIDDLMGRYERASRREDPAEPK